MKTTEIITVILLTGLCCFILRWAINWILLNKVNKTNYSPFRASYSLSDIIPMFRHVAISEWKVWWRGEEYSTLKVVSNTLSVIIYSCVALMIVLLSVLDK
ncbi:hypothetical protein Q0590_34415 [Rhodocytophaga aerolata]|uniref:YggT family protein n=1 Tax=Rhodocytophaga aerolata TaxID=455078 RepID=A0ABT8RK55_9BACT|nr:hypothetical protein [Rhodocytophaga aerolata]MDO1451420.1 hypothetical protein [Rhodocytophaga aerolata]